MLIFRPPHLARSLCRFTAGLLSSHPMSRPLRFEFPGAVWHLYNRGVNRQDIFFDDDDRNLFLDILKRTVHRYGWLVHAWAQMTNHYHLLVETPQTNLSAGMRDLDRDYAQPVVSLIAQPSRSSATQFARFAR